jgi:hypothetical protein
MKTNLQYVPHEGNFSCCEPQRRINTRSIFFLINQTTTPKKSNSERLLSSQKVSSDDAQKHGHIHAVTIAVCQVANITVSSHYEEVCSNSKHAVPHDNTHTCILCTGSAKAMPLLLVKNIGNDILNKESLAEVSYACSPIPEKRAPL